MNRGADYWFMTQYPGDSQQSRLFLSNRTQLAPFAIPGPVRTFIDLSAGSPRSQPCQPRPAAGLPDLCGISRHWPAWNDASMSGDATPNVSALAINVTIPEGLCW